ncbi:Eukaryotic translation initiation factor 3 subunit A [Gigaspora margarita]|uniref:Eukaryotic translation initiation factor 3 subunit A n=1 Tax=Gigaspora margarita TaxID=4874 RepID=A0A8H3XGV6_GIGMA|nr:Eukaryotic translation initiation factor 3 subunit A [Gigaspora margarita]
MAPFYQRPENALKRAEELIAVGQNVAALTSLHEIVISKRSRSTSLTALEPIMLRFVELCVNLRKGKTAKEGLHQYKNISQNTSVTTIELVIKKFIELSEEKVAAAQAKADQITLDAIDDLEASETPESIMLSTVSGEQSKDRTDRAVVTPWLKFLWEAYRTVLDILRNNARLEVLYQQTAHQAFQFCLKYTRKTEFRRLCELLRNHLQNIAKYAHQPHSINLNEPETLQRHLDTRFYQLNAAVELELWQEAFRSVEDIHNLLSMSKRPPKPVMMANYYDKLTKIFLVSENYLFHASAWNRYYTLVKAQNKALTDEESTRMASFVLLSALAIPVITSSRTRMLEIDDNKNKQHRLASLLGMSRSPTRSGLLKEALNKNILRRVRPELRELYNILEVQFHPLSICKKIEPIMNHLSQNTEMAKYVKPLHQVILTRLFQQLSQVYDSVKLDFVINLASFAPPYNYDAATIEKFIMNGCKKGELSIRIDHATSSLTFETDLFAASKNADADGAKLQASPADRMRDQLSRLAKCFYTTVHMIDPTIIEAKQNARAQALSRALTGMEEEHNNALARKAIIERRRELVETLLMRKEKEEQRERAIRQKQRDEELKQRQMEEAKKRELERKKREREAIQKEETRKLAETLKLQNLKIEPEELDKLDPDKIVRLQVERLEKEKRELNDRLRSTAKRMDHLERAYRKEEIPLLEKDYERQRKIDRAYHEAARKLQLETAFAKHNEDLKLKERLMRILPDYQNYRKEIESKRHEEFERRRKAAQAKIEEEKEKRRQIFLAKLEEERLRKEEEEEAMRKEEEEERRRAEELARLEEERRLRKEKEELEYQERKRKLDEQARLQAEVERKAEERLKRQQEEKERADKEDQERRRRKESNAGYVPPALRSRTDSAKDTGTGTGTGAWRRPSETTTKDEPWRRSEESAWRRSDSGRGSTTEETDRRRSGRNDEVEWRRSDSGRGTSTTEDKAWRRTSVTATSTREEPGSWRRSGPPSNDRGDGKLRSREDSWRSEDSEQSSSSRGPTRILKSESTGWRARSRQQAESSIMERTSSGRTIWTATLQEQMDDTYDEDSTSNLEDTPTESKVINEPAKQTFTAEPDDDGFIPVSSKGKRRG